MVKIQARLLSPASSSPRFTMPAESSRALLCRILTIAAIRSRDTPADPCLGNSVIRFAPHLKALMSKPSDAPGRTSSSHKNA
jgi:hypothetical protein